MTKMQYSSMSKNGEIATPTSMHSGSEYDNSSPPELRRSYSSSTVSLHSPEILTPTGTPSPRITGSENGNDDDVANLKVEDGKSFTESLLEVEQDYQNKPEPQVIAPDLLSYDWAHSHSHRSLPSTSRDHSSPDSSANSYVHTMPATLCSSSYSFERTSSPPRFFQQHQQQHMTVNMRCLQARDTNIMAMAPQLPPTAVWRKSYSSCLISPDIHQHQRTHEYRPTTGFLLSSSPRNAVLTALHHTIPSQRYDSSSTSSTTSRRTRSASSHRTSTPGPSRRRHPAPAPKPPKEKYPVVVSMDDKAHICPVSDCNKRFGRQEHLRRHIETHNDSKPYKCDLCGRPFKRNDNCRTHRGLHLKKKPRMRREYFPEAAEKAARMKAAKIARC